MQSTPLRPSRRPPSPLTLRNSNHHGFGSNSSRGSSAAGPETASPLSTAATIGTGDSRGASPIDAGPAWPLSGIEAPPPPGGEQQNSRQRRKITAAASRSGEEDSYQIPDVDRSLTGVGRSLSARPPSNEVVFPSTSLGWPIVLLTSDTPPATQQCNTGAGVPEGIIEGKNTETGPSNASTGVSKAAIEHSPVRSNSNTFFCCCCSKSKRVKPTESSQPPLTGVPK